MRFMRLHAPVQATPKWFEGPSDQGIYWSISDDFGLTWGPTTLIVPAAENLPQWGGPCCTRRCLPHCEGAQ